MNTMHYHIGLPNETGSLFWTGSTFDKDIHEAKAYQSHGGAQTAATRISRAKELYVVICGNSNCGDFALIEDWWRHYRDTHQRDLNHNFPDRQLTIEDFRAMAITNRRTGESCFESPVFRLKGRDCRVSVWFSTPCWRFMVQADDERIAYGTAYATRSAAETAAKDLIEFIAA